MNEIEFLLLLDKDKLSVEEAKQLKLFVEAHPEAQEVLMQHKALEVQLKNIALRAKVNSVRTSKPNWFSFSYLAAALFLLVTCGGVLGWWLTREKDLPLITPTTAPKLIEPRRTEIVPDPTLDSLQTTKNYRRPKKQIEVVQKPIAQGPSNEQASVFRDIEPNEKDKRSILLKDKSLFFLNQFTPIDSDSLTWNASLAAMISKSCTTSGLESTLDAALLGSVCLMRSQRYKAAEIALFEQYSQDSPHFTSVQWLLAINFILSGNEEAGKNALVTIKGSPNHPYSQSAKAILGN